jgi:hypothetical protein
MYIPDKLLETKHTYDKESQDYFKQQGQRWIYEKWAKRANKQIPNLATRIFNLREKSYVGHGFHYGIERRLGNIIAKLNDYDDCPREIIKIITHKIVMKTAVNRLFDDVVKAERSMVKT